MKALKDHDYKFVGDRCMEASMALERCLTVMALDDETRKALAQAIGSIATAATLAGLQNMEAHP